MGLDEGMRHRAEDRDAVALAGKHRGGAGESGDVARSRRPEAGLGAVRAAQAEIDQRLARRRQHHARRLGGDQRLEMQNVDQARLHQLRLRQRRGHAQDRLVGEEHRALRHGVDVAGEAKPRELVEQALPKRPVRASQSMSSAEKRRLFEKVERLLEPGRHQEAAPRRQLAHEELEYRGLGLAMIQSRPASC